MKRHGGHLFVESEQGKGTSFHIFLPAAAEKVTSVGLESTSIKLEKFRILVMDDEEPVLRVVTRLLELLGQDVENVSDGRAAIDAYESAIQEGKPFDAVILDLTVPGAMGGKNAAREIRDKYPDARLVVSSGYSSDPIMSNPGQYGFDAVIKKPYRAEEMREVLFELLNK